MFDIIFFAALAFFIGYRLYNVLGKGDFSPKSPITVPETNKVIETSYVEVPHEDDSRLEEIYGPKIAANIREVRKVDVKFNVENFLYGAKKAFEVTIKSFAKGDKEALKPLLSKEVFASFSTAIDARNNLDKVEDNTLVAILSANIKDIAINKKYALIVVNFISEQINIVRDKQGNIIDGNPSQMDKIEETWTFGRDITSADPNWLLLETAVT